MIRSLTIALGMAWLAYCSPASAESKPGGYEPERDGYSVRSHKFGWWSADLRIIVGNRRGGRGITGISCVLQGTDGAAFTLTKSAESHRLIADFTIDILDKDWSLVERQPVSLGIGGRTYEFDRIPWDFDPALLGWETLPPEITDIIPMGHGMTAFRAGQGYPWLPAEYLIPALMEVETLRLGYQGQKEVKHGDYQTVYRERNIRMEGFREGMKWCGDALSSERSINLPPELRQ